MALGEFVEIVRHRLGMQIDVGGEFSGARQAGDGVGFLHDVVGHRLHHHEIDVGDLVIAGAHGVERAHTVRDVAVHAQTQLVRQIGHRFDPGRIERTVELDGEIAVGLRALDGGERFVERFDKHARLRRVRPRAVDQQGGYDARPQKDAVVDTLPARHRLRRHVAGIAHACDTRR